MEYNVGDKIKVNGSIQEIENITQRDKDTQLYKFVGVSGWHEVKEGVGKITRIYVVRTDIGTYLILDTIKREWDYTSIPPQDDDIKYAYKFDDKCMAEGIAKLVEGKVEEIER